MNDIYSNYPELLNYFYQADLPSLHQHESISRCVTFVVTDACQLRCTYCYEKDKSNNFMSKETAKKAVDTLFNLYYEDKRNSFINKKTKAIILEFIGGEPFLNIDIIDYICSYFFQRCIEEKHIWAINSKISISSNGVNYFDEKVQSFIKKFKNMLSLQFSIDGPKHIHDSCRLFPDGKTGSFDLANAAQNHYTKHYNSHIETKITISPENMMDIKSIIEFFINKKVSNIFLNCIFEHEWTIEDCKLLYKALKEAADYLLKNNIQIPISIFSTSIGYPIPETDVQCWCGGTGKMLAVNWDGDYYPCTRFCPVSMGQKCNEVYLGSVQSGLLTTRQEKENLKALQSITRKTKSSKECFYCPVAAGCADCAAWNFQASSKLNSRNKNICNAHKVRCIANAYYWNNFYKNNNIPLYFQLNLTEEECLKYIDKKEYDKIISLRGFI